MDMEKIRKLSMLGLMLFLISSAFANAQQYNCPMGGVLFGGYGAGMMAVGWIFNLLIIALIVSAIYWFVKNHPP